MVTIRVNFQGTVVHIVKVVPTVIIGNIIASIPLAFSGKPDVFDLKV